jgi:hypothetical protein
LCQRCHPNLLLAFDNTVLAGGYFFVPPLAHPNRPCTWTLPTGSAMT